MWNNHRMYFWWASGSIINIYIQDLEVNIKSLQIEFVNDRRTGRAVGIDEDTAFKQGSKLSDKSF